MMVGTKGKCIITTHSKERKVVLKRNLRQAHHYKGLMQFVQVYRWSMRHNK